MNEDIDFCKGINCALASHCKRYLAGVHFSDDGYPHWWIDNCDPETRPLYLED